MSRTITVPDWLNESFLQEVLEQDKSLNGKINVKSVVVGPAEAFGANYVGNLFRVRGTYQLEDDSKQMKDVSLIVKTPNTSDVIGKCYGDSSVKEYIAYKEFLPEVYKVLKTEPFAAKLLFYSPDHIALVLEDLKAQGFVMADRLKQLDFEHCLVCLKTLAILHASSIVVVRKNPHLTETLGKEMLYDRRNLSSYQRSLQMTKSAASLFTKAVQNWGNFQDFKEKSRNVWETLHNDLCDVFEPRKDFLNVMNHGDLWTNNMMFKYDSGGNIVDFKLVDWQVCRYATPALDLIYLLFTSANQEVRHNRMDRLLSVYVESLNSRLEQLNCEHRLTRNQLDAELKRSQCYIFYVTYSILSIALSDPDDLPNLDELTELNIMSAEGNPFEKCYYGRYYTGIAQQILNYLDTDGFFNK